VSSDLTDLIIAHAKRPLPSKLDAAFLAATADDAVAGQVYDFALGKIGANTSDEIEILASLPVGVRNLYITSLVHFEVLNGGFNQFYFNSTRKFALVAPQAFEYFGAHTLAKIVRAANAQRSSESRVIRAVTRIRTMATFMESYRHSKLGPLDTQYAELQNTIGPLWVARIRATPQEFFGA
jgi:Domain of unknown function (DUF4375)